MVAAKTQPAWCYSHRGHGEEPVFSASLPQHGNLGRRWQLSAYIHLIQVLFLRRGRVRSTNHILPPRSTSCLRLTTCGIEF